jgi:hypothetical protein
MEKGVVEDKEGDETAASIKDQKRQQQSQTLATSSSGTKAGLHRAMERKEQTIGAVSVSPAMTATLAPMTTKAGLGRNAVPAVCVQHRPQTKAGLRRNSANDNNTETSKVGAVATGPTTVRPTTKVGLRRSTQNDLAIPVSTTIPPIQTKAGLLGRLSSGSAEAIPASTVQTKAGLRRAMKNRQPEAPTESVPVNNTVPIKAGLRRAMENRHQPPGGEVPAASTPGNTVPTKAGLGRAVGHNRQQQQQQQESTFASTLPTKAGVRRAMEHRRQEQHQEEEPTPASTVPTKAGLRRAMEHRRQQEQEAQSQDDSQSEVMQDIEAQQPSFLQPETSPESADDEESQSLFEESEVRGTPETIDDASTQTSRTTDVSSAQPSSYVVEPTAANLAVVSNDQLVEALPVAGEEEVPRDMVEAEEIDEEQLQQRIDLRNQKAQLFNILAFVLSIVAFCAVVLGVVFSKRPPPEPALATEKPTLSPTIAPSSSPTAAPTTVVDGFLPELLPLLPNETVASLGNTLSPQYKAAAWLAKHPRIDE